MPPEKHVQQPGRSNRQCPPAQKRGALGGTRSPQLSPNSVNVLLRISLGLKQPPPPRRPTILSTYNELLSLLKYLSLWLNCNFQHILFLSRILSHAPGVYHSELPPSCVLKALHLKRFRKAISCFQSPSTEVSQFVNAVSSARLYSS